MRSRGGGTGGPPFGSPRVDLPPVISPSRPSPCSPPVSDPRFGSGVGVSVEGGLSGMFLQGSEGAPGLNGAAGEPYLRPGQASPPADHRSADRLPR